MTNVIVMAPNAVSRMATTLALAWRYLAVLVVPHPLVCDMGYPQVVPVTFADWRAFAGFAAYVGMAAWACWQVRRRSFPAFAVLFYLISFSLISNVFILVGTNYAERALYTPSLGFAFALAWTLIKFFPAAPSRAQRPALLWVAACVVLVLYGANTVSRNMDWKDDFILFDTDIRVSPNSALLVHNYGIRCLHKGYDRHANILRDAGLVQKSIDLFTKAYKAFPGNYEAIGYRGYAYSKLKKYDLAIADYEKAIELSPNNPAALSALGYLYRNVRNQPDKAEELYRRAVAVDPRFVEARRNLGAVLASRRKFAEAIEQWKEGLKYAPEDLRLNQYIGQAYVDMGQPELGRPFQEKAAAIK
jgi:tetratricopeptide (TPR) repeat protein